MTRQAVVFWGAAIAVALLVAVLSALLLPYGTIGLDSLEERQRAWLLTLWTAGVMSVLLGVSSLLGAFSGLGLRDALEAGSLQRAQAARRESLSGEERAFHRSFGWWLVCEGGLLVATYFAAWVALH